MIAVEKRGRLGNQLFQFAFGLAAARQLGTTFVMDDHELRDFFSLAPYDGVAARVARASRYRLEQRIRPYRIEKVDNDFTSIDDVRTRIRDRTHFAGFFQSEEFFRDVAAEVRRAFVFRDRQIRAYEERYDWLCGQPYVCCHVRRTDYLAWMGGVALPASYYAEALECIGAAPGTPVVFVGDDLDEVENTFGARPDVSFERNGPGVDLQLLAGANAVVVSNSSFGWWGAWLGDPNRLVIAPRHWLGFREGDEWPPAIIPTRWRQLAIPGF